MPEREISVIRPDTDALRAMSHPTRLRMLGLLRSDGAATASALANRLGLNSGATSYHLRQLADAGLVVEDESLGSKRDRWWKAAHESTRTHLGADDEPEHRAATLAFVRAAVQQQVSMLQEADAEREDLPEAWLDATTNSDWGIRMTAAQARALVDRLGDVLTEAFENEPDEDEAPEDAETVIFQLHAFPRPGRVTRPGDESLEQSDATEPSER